MAYKTNEKEWLTIPILPCISIEETLAFWATLGFNVIYKQTRPYQYGIVTRGGYQLHFGGVKGMEAKDNLHGGCLITVSDAEEVYQEFIQKLKGAFGKVSNSGIPRISRMKPGTTRFTLTDVAGNSIIFVRLGVQDSETWKNADRQNQSPLQKAIATAIRFRDYKNDEKAAARTLDVALRKTENEAATDIAEALVIRIDLADFMNEPLCSNEYRALLNKMSLTPEEKKKLQDKQLGF